jgi:uncharacterized repeat protein (TIGR01451 family)
MIQVTRKGFYLVLPLVSGLFLLLATLFGLRGRTPSAYADPIDPPEGYPKLSQSVKTVTPMLAGTGGETLLYTIEIRNTGAYTAEETSLSDVIPANTSYNGDAWSSVSPDPAFSGGAVQWQGDVGFDSTVVVTFSVDVDPGFEGTVQNTAVITDPMIDEPVNVTAETVVTDDPFLVIGKASAPARPGANQPLTYTLVVTNLGQPANNLAIEVEDDVPADTTFSSAGPDGSYSAGTVTWNRNVTLDTGDTTEFTFVVDVNDVLSGTVITNDTYQVSNGPDVTAGEVHTTTVIDPILFIYKDVWPDPPGSNRELTYTLTVFNKGSLATDLEVSDTVPEGVTFERANDGGSFSDGVVSWPPIDLDSNESAQFSYVVSVGDVADVLVINSDYEACLSGNVCQAGDPLTSTVHGATFLATAEVDPIAKKPGRGNTPVTPTLTIENLGPGNALDATAFFKFERISVQESDFIATPNVGSISPGPECGDKCRSYIWQGDLDFGQTITFTTIEGQNSVGGEEGTLYTATVVISDSLSNTTTEPITATAAGKVTHFANLIPIKSAPTVIGRGQLLTYTIRVWNSALSTDVPPYPVLTDTVPLSTTFVGASDGGVEQTVGDSTVVSWTLPAMGTGEELHRSFTVRVDGDLVSGTHIINNEYGTRWYEPEASAVFSNTGQPVTTTVKEVGLIDSYKEVTPALALPGTGNVLTYYLHIVNSSPVPLNGVDVYDYLPWEWSTYQRDARVSSGTLISDIVSVEWTGSVDAYSAETITMTVLVDPGFEGPITNTAVIDHPSLLEPVTVDAVAYITDDPVLEISKLASPDPVKAGDELLYTIRVANLGQQATGLVITDTIPSNSTYVADSATGSGRLVGDQVRWQIPVLEPEETRTFSFRVEVGGGREIVNEYYGVSSAEGITAVGSPVTITIRGGAIYLPVILRQ